MASSISAAQRKWRSDERNAWSTLRNTDREEGWSSARDVPQTVREYERLRWAMVRDDPDDVPRSRLDEDEADVLRLGPVLDHCYLTSGWHMDPNVPTPGSPSLASAEPSPFFVEAVPDLTLAPVVKNLYTDWEHRYAGVLSTHIARGNNIRNNWIDDLGRQQTMAGKGMLLAALKHAIHELKSCELPLERGCLLLTRRAIPSVWKEHEQSKAQCKTEVVLAAARAVYRCEHCDSVRGHLHYTNTAHWYVECKDCSRVTWLNLVPSGLATWAPLSNDIEAYVNTWEALKSKIRKDVAIARQKDRIHKHEAQRLTLVDKFRPDTAAPQWKQEQDRAKFTKLLAWHIEIERNAHLALSKLESTP